MKEYLRNLYLAMYLAVYQSLREVSKLLSKLEISLYITGYHGKSGTNLARGRYIRFPLIVASHQTNSHYGYSIEG